MANLGMYHPTYNPTGARRASDNLPWYNTTVDFNSTADCFNTAKLDLTSGLIGGSTGSSNQYPFADAIYAGQVEDLRLNANKLDVNQLREESIRKAVAGEMRGKGKVPFTTVLSTSPDKFTTPTGRIYRISGSGDSMFIEYDSEMVLALRDKFSIGDVVRVNDRENDVYILGTINGFDTSGSSLNVLIAGTYNGYTVVPNYNGNISDLTLLGILVEQQLPPEFDSLPWVDIIGDPERIAATFPDGVVGQWIPQIPDGTNTFTLNRKRAGSGSLPQVFTDSDGVSWTDATTAYNGVPNTIGDNGAVGRVSLIVYESNSNFTEPSNNSVVVGDVGDVIFTDGYTVETGNRLQPSLTGEIGKDNTTGNFNRNVKMQYHFIEDGEFSTDVALDNKHIELPEFVPANDSPAVKALSTVTNKDGLLYLQLHGSELVYDGGSATRWGDDEIIPIVDGENTKTDLNGTTVKTFCHHTQIPLGITNYNKTTT